MCGAPGQARQRQQRRLLLLLLLLLGLRLACAAPALCPRRAACSCPQRCPRGKGVPCTCLPQDEGVELVDILELGVAVEQQRGVVSRCPATGKMAYCRGGSTSARRVLEEEGDGIGR